MRNRHVRTAAWLAAGAIAIGTAAHSRTAVAQDNAALAQRRLSNAIRLYDAHNYEGALPEFRASFSLYASPNTRLYIARSLRGLGRLPEAVAEYERTVSEATDRAQHDPRYVSTRDAATNELRGVVARVGHVTVNVPGVPANAHVEVAGVELPVAGLGVSMPVMPGHVSVTVRADGFDPAEASAEVTAGQSANIDVTLHPAAAQAVASAAPQSGPPASSAAPPHAIVPAPPRSVLLPLGITGLTIGVVGFATFGAFYFLANQRFQQLDTQCNHTTCSTAQIAAIDEGRTYQTLTNVGLGVGAGGLAVGVLLLALTPLEHRSPVHVAVTPSSITFAGEF